LRFDSQGARQSAGFEYHPDWLASEERFPLEPALPLVGGMQFHKRAADGSIFHSVIADTEPDGWARRVILRDDAKQRQIARQKGAESRSEPLNALDYLLTVDDTSRVGALRFRDEHGTFQRASVPHRRTTPPLIELSALLSATKAVESNTETAEDLAYLRGRGTSLGGLRPKCSVVDDDGALSIAKFPSVQDDRPTTKGEVLALHLARMAGIDAADARLVGSDGAAVALIRRFDRTPAGRLLYASAATLLGAEPSDAQEHSYTEIVDSIRRYSPRAREDIEELWRRLAFSVLITNVDDHLHNHGFLHEGKGQWRLSPAFDVNPFPDRARELKTWVSEGAGPAATVDAVMSVAPYFRIERGAAKKLIQQVEQAVSQWRIVGRKLNLTSSELDLFADAFEHQERVAAQRL
jgi:serine/threonine-protein kinase HipA